MISAASGGPRLWPGSEWAICSTAKKKKLTDSPNSQFAFSGEMPAQDGTHGQRRYGGAMPQAVIHRTRTPRITINDQRVGTARRQVISVLELTSRSLLALSAPVSIILSMTPPSLIEAFQPHYLCPKIRALAGPVFLTLMCYVQRFPLTVGNRGSLVIHCRPEPATCGFVPNLEFRKER